MGIKISSFIVFAFIFAIRRQHSNSGYKSLIFFPKFFLPQSKIQSAMSSQFFKTFFIALSAGISGFALAAMLPSAGPGESLLSMNGSLVVDMATEELEWLPGQQASANEVCKGFIQRWENMEKRQVEERQESVELLILGLTPLLDASQTQVLHNNLEAYERKKK